MKKQFLAMMMLFFVGGISVHPGPPLLHSGFRNGFGSKVAAESGIPLAHRFGLKTGKFVVATTELRSPAFSETVVLLLEHGSNGTIGVIVNRPTQHRLSDVLDLLDDPSAFPGALYWGGPVAKGQLLMLLRSHTPPDGSIHVTEEVYWINETERQKQILDTNTSKAGVRIFAGYAGWGPGQLEEEVIRGSWRIVQADAESVFSSKIRRLWIDLYFQSSSKWGMHRIPHFRHAASARLPYR